MSPRRRCRAFRGGVYGLQVESPRQLFCGRPLISNGRQMAAGGERPGVRGICVLAVDLGPPPAHPQAPGSEDDYPRSGKAQHTPLPGSCHWLSLIERSTFPEPITNGALTPRAGLCARRQDLLPPPSQGGVRLGIHASVARLSLCRVPALPGITSPDCCPGLWPLPTPREPSGSILHSASCLPAAHMPRLILSPAVTTTALVIFPSSTTSSPFRFS